MRYHGEVGTVDFVVVEKAGDRSLDWYVEKFPGGGVMITAETFGPVFLSPKPDTDASGTKSAVGQMTIGGWKDKNWQKKLQDKKDFGWDELFKKSDPSKCLCCAQ